LKLREIALPMEYYEHQLIQEIVHSNQDLKKLYNRHLKLEKELEHIEKYAPYSSTAAIQHSKLKKEKLKGKEEIMAILSQFKGLANN
jgi:uncharacterized protein YdcH (DUF465 family)